MVLEVSLFTETTVAHVTPEGPGSVVDIHVTS